jgi:hypothetical protein
MKNHPVTQTEYYQTIKYVVDNLKTSGMLQAGSGYCVSMSDIIHKLLHKEGIKSQIVECSLMVTLKDPPGLFLMGYPGFNQNNYTPDKMISTHVVCVTETEIPILIDLSIGHIDKDIPYICSPIMRNYDHANLAEYDFESSTWTYTRKPETEVELPKLHQRSILDRIKLDNQIQQQIGVIQKLVLIALSISSMNLIRGGYDFYQTYVNPNNDWGPTKTNIVREHEKVGNQK